MSGQDEGGRTTRRQALGNATTAALLGVAAAGAAEACLPEPEAGPASKNGRIRQSLVQWCYDKYWNIEEMIGIARQLGCESIELGPAKLYPTLKKHGMTCAIGSIDMGDEPPFVKGFNNPKHREKVMKATRDAIDACADYGYRNVICFTGMSDGIPADEGAANCVEGFKEILALRREDARSRSAWRCSTRATTRTR